MMPGGAVTRRQAKFNVPEALQEPHRSRAPVIRTPPHREPHPPREVLHPVLENLPRPRTVPGAKQIPRPGGQVGAQQKLPVLPPQILPAFDKPQSKHLAQEGEELTLAKRPRLSLLPAQPRLGELPLDPAAVTIEEGRHLAGCKPQRRADEDLSFPRNLDGDRFPSRADDGVVHGRNAGFRVPGTGFRVKNNHKKVYGSRVYKSPGEINEKDR